MSCSEEEDSLSRWSPRLACLHEMRDIVAFHPTARGSAVYSVSGRADLVERRAEALSRGGVVFSAWPLKPKQRICVELRRRRRQRHRDHDDDDDVPGWPRLGFTCHDPATLANDLPPFAVPDLTDRDGFWARPVGDLGGVVGGRVTVWLEDDGSARWIVDGVDRGVLVGGLPVQVPLWLLVDLYGPFTSARLVPPSRNLLYLIMPRR